MQKRSPKSRYVDTQQEPAKSELVPKGHDSLAAGMLSIQSGENVHTSTWEETSMSMMLAQILMVLTLILMITGRTPIYLTAILGSSIAALVAGFPLVGKEEITIVKMINSGLNPVIADMTGVLMFIGIMQAAGFLDVIIRDIIRFGRNLGGGPGVAAAGGIAAGCVGALTGFTQPVITAVITGPASVRLGVEPSKSAGLHAHAGHLGNLGGFTHPTQVAIIAAAGISFGLFNVLGAVIALSVFAASVLRLKIAERRAGQRLSDTEMADIIAEFEKKDYAASSRQAFAPFGVLVVGFVLGFPIFLVGIIAAVFAIYLSKFDLKKAETEMLTAVGKIATPLVATIGFLYMSTVIRNVGLVQVISDLINPVLTVAPIQIMLVVAALTALMTQSYGASAAIILPFLQVVLKTGADPFAAALAAAAGGAITQYFLTGGPVAALATVIPVIPGSELKTANRFQRPSILAGLGVAFVITFLLGM